MNPGTVFYTVLNMGLGHASRSLPIMREFVNRGWRLVIGANGRALNFLQNEIPAAEFITTPDYALRYAKGALLPLSLLAQTPQFLAGIRAEQKLCRKAAQLYQPKLIISDHCYGMSHPEIPSYFITHQVYFAMPPGLERFSALPARFNFHYHRHFGKIIIPDLPDENGGRLSGRLSRLPRQASRYHYAGLLSSVAQQNIKPDIDVLVSISGPEPQRTLFEKLVLEQIETIPGKKVVLLGKSESTRTLCDREALKVYSHLPRQAAAELMNRARLIVSRPGYSTLMETAELGKPALFVPTPGQTEQVYLARRLQEQGWFHSVAQHRLKLADDIERARSLPGLHIPDATQRTLERLFNHILDI